MSRRLLRHSATALMLAAVLSSCASTPSNSRAAAMIIDELPPGQVERTEHLSLGRFTMALVRTLVRMVDDLDEEEAAIVRSIRRVEISTYSIDPPLQGTEQLRFDRVGQALTADGWSPMIRNRDVDDATLLLVQENDKGKISGIFVLTGDTTEFEVIRVEGKLDKMIAEAIADEPEILAGLSDS